MSFVALTNFIVITTSNGDDPVGLSPNRFQNGKYDVPITHVLTNKDHHFLSFNYMGASRNRTGDNMTSSLILANSEISMKFAVEAVQEKYHVKVQTYLMTEAFEQQTKLTEEQWLVSSMSYDPEAIEVILSSAIDAVGANAPDRVLTQEIVGHLPVTGSLQNR